MGVCSEQDTELNDMFSSADDLFRKVLHNPAHVLYRLLPPKKENSYKLRTRAHDRVLPIASVAASKNFIHRMLFKHAY